MELEKNRRAFAKAGYGICAISYDSVKILKHFANRKKIAFPMLSDAGSKVIEKFGILKDRKKRLPFPGTYVVDRRGRVVSKDFRESYRERIGMGALLVTELGADPVTRGFTARTPHLVLTVRASADFTYPETAFTLVYDIKLKPKMHVYAPDVKGYIPVSISLDDGGNVRRSKTNWAESKPFH